MTHSRMQILTALLALVAVLPAYALNAPITVFQGTITDLEKKAPEEVNLAWKSPDYGDVPSPEEGEVYVVISVLLGKDCTISKLDFDLKDETSGDVSKCLATRIDSDQPFSPDKPWAFSQPGLKVDLLYLLPDSEQYELQLNYNITTMPHEYLRVAIDLRPPVVEPPPVAEGDVPVEGDAPMDADADVQIPADFTLAWLTGTIDPIDLVLSKTDDTELIDDGKFITVVAGNDAVAGTNGFGLAVTREGESMMWTPAPIALYRDQKLLGVYDPQADTFAMPADADAVPVDLVLPAAADAAAPEPAADEPAAEPEAPAPAAEPEKPAPVKKDPPKKADPPKKKEEPKKESGGGGMGWGF